MNVTCPRCRAVYRVDPRKVPQRGVRARCTACAEVFAVERAAADEVPAAGPAPQPVPAAEPPAPEPAPAPPPAVPFGAVDPDARARRLARALVSDILVYHPDRHARARDAGTLRQEFRDEVRKSWDEFVGQVGEDVARSTPYFRDALNEILAGGARVF